MCRIANAASRLTFGFCCIAMVLGSSFAPGNEPGPFNERVEVHELAIGEGSQELLHTITGPGQSLTSREFLFDTPVDLDGVSGINLNRARLHICSGPPGSPTTTGFLKIALKNGDNVLFESPQTDLVSGTCGSTTVHHGGRAQASGFADRVVVSVGVETGASSGTARLTALPGYESILLLFIRGNNPLQGHLGNNDSRRVPVPSVSIGSMQQSAPQTHLFEDARDADVDGHGLRFAVFGFNAAGGVSGAAVAELILDDDTTLRLDDAHSPSSGRPVIGDRCSANSLLLSETDRERLRDRMIVGFRFWLVTAEGGQLAVQENPIAPARVFFMYDFSDCDPGNNPQLDCDADGRLDSCQIAAGELDDCDGNWIPDACEIQSDGDCNGDGALDVCQITAGELNDCDGNGIPDECEIEAGGDCNGDGSLDACQLRDGELSDCNDNEIPDTCDIAVGTSADANENQMPDECETVLSLSTDRIDFGEVKVSERRILQFSIENRGPANVVLRTLDVGSPIQPNPDFVGPDPADESITLPAVLEPGDSLGFELTYSPATAEPDDEFLHVNSDAAIAAPAVRVVGIGVENGPTRFVRGDGNADGGVDLSDATFTLNWLFLGGSVPICHAATDVDGTSGVNISDPTYLLNFLFLGGPAPIAPFPECGTSNLASDAELGCSETPDHCN